MKKSIKELVNFIYGEKEVPGLLDSLEKLSRKWSSHLVSPEKDWDSLLPLDQQDAVMITYGDNIQKEGQSHLASLKEFSDQYLRDILSGIHILPFSPYSSDDGFSVIDYRKVNPDWGDWKEMQALGEHFRLMFDLVLNHCSAKSDWFRKFLESDPVYKNYFIVQDPTQDLSAVFRPRALPLLHPFQTNEGEKYLWTTFSEDQVDLNFSNPRVMLEFLDILFFYISQGAQIIRLDAIGFLWKEVGTSCMHHPKTHAMVQLYRALLERVAPWVVLLTETNVPHKENISYFGEGDNEAQLVYQFALPPLTLDAFLREDSTHLQEWASTLEPPAKDHSFFNFLASHDGIGVLPARTYLKKEEMENLLDQVQKRGGRVSYKNTPEGPIPYELNINYADALAEKSLSLQDRAAKFLASQSIIIAFSGIPGIYIHSILGSGNWEEGIELLGQNRSINREKISLEDLEKELNNPQSFRSRVFNGFTTLLQIRKSEPAFHPAADQIILPSDKRCFCFLRVPEVGEPVLVIVNLSHEEVHLVLDLQSFYKDPSGKAWTDLITSVTPDVHIGSDRFQIELTPWQICWLK